LYEGSSCLSMLTSRVVSICLTEPKVWSSVLLIDLKEYVGQFFDSATTLAVDIDQCL